MMNFTGAVLAGGHSTRMGTDKAFLRVGTEIWLHRQLRLLREAGARELIVSGRHGVDYGVTDATLVFDGILNGGPLAGVAAALEAASYDAVLVLAVDMAGMTVSTLARILTLTSSEMGCVPVSGDCFEPLAASYPKRLLPWIHDHMRDGRLAMHDLVKVGLGENFLRTMNIEEAERSSFANCNRPFDLDGGRRDLG